MLNATFCPIFKHCALRKSFSLHRLWNYRFANWIRRQQISIRLSSHSKLQSDWHIFRDSSRRKKGLVLIIKCIMYLIMYSSGYSSLLHNINVVSLMLGPPPIYPESWARPLAHGLDFGTSLGHFICPGITLHRLHHSRGLIGKCYPSTIKVNEKVHLLKKVPRLCKDACTKLCTRPFVHMIRNIHTTMMWL